MKLSEAILLGSTMIKPKAGVFITPDGKQGCAWGMVGAAAPASYPNFATMAGRRSETQPCNCATTLIIGSGLRYQERAFTFSLSDWIVHVFNCHVMTVKDWTLDRLVQWVASVEPAEPEAVVTKPVTERKEELVCP